MAVVIDASIAAAWCFPDERAQAAEHVLDILPQTGGVVPGLFRHEIRNILIASERRGRIDRTQSVRFLTRLRNLQLAQDDSHDEDTVLALARNRRLSAYDASYLETALRRGDSLATLDRALARAASAEGVAVIA